MNDLINEEKKENLEELNKLYEITLNQVEEGKIIKGKVVKIIGNEVLVDINYKSEGIVPLYEFEKDKAGMPLVKIGDEINVFVESLQGMNEEIVLSKKKAESLQNWQEVIRIYKNDALIEGKIIYQVKGGYKVDIGVEAFLPGSQIDRKEIQDINQFIGKKLQMKIIKLDEERKNVVLSRKIIAEADKEQKRKKILQDIEIGQIKEGVVKNLASYGAFVDIGGIDGLLHITDMSWRRIKAPQDMLSIGDKIEVMILSLDKESSRITLGLKQKTKDPWSNIDERYFVNSRVNGKVIKITDYGAFIELEEGIEGLLHISEMAWTKKIKHPKDLLTLNETIEVVILKIDKETRRILLGLKQLQENPWLMLDLKYPMNSIIEGVVISLTNYGAFIELEEGIEGLLHISDMSWTQNIQHPSEILKVGDKIKAMILYVDKESEKIAIGLKQLKPDPWNTIPEKYKEGDYIKGRVKKITSFGIFVELEPQIEGLVHISQLSIQRVVKPEVLFFINQEVWAKIIKVDTKERKIGLSIKEYIEETTNQGEENGEKM